MTPGEELFRRSFDVGRADLVAYANASGDQNPIHQDEDAARAAGLPGVIAHGMLTMGLAARALADWAGGPERVGEISARFARPVVVPPAPGVATIEVTGTVRKVANDGRVEVNLTVMCGEDKVIAPARATVTTNRRPTP